MARRDDLFKIAEQHDLKIGTIEDLIRYRVQNEKTIKREHEVVLNTDYGQFNAIAFKDDTSGHTHLALIKGDLSADKAPLVRVHLEDSLCDTLSLNDEGCSWPLRNVMSIMEEEGEGVIVILRGNTQNNVVDRLKELDADHEQQPDQSDGPTNLRTFGIGAQILSDVGVTKMRVMSAPMKLHGFAGFGFEITENVRK
jgi:3,4-dihydroxy 2-butanone 4-phosphate synthase/GTP cyclohydrolase II